MAAKFTLGEVGDIVDDWMTGAWTAKAGSQAGRRSVDTLGALSLLRQTLQLTGQRLDLTLFRLRFRE